MLESWKEVKEYLKKCIESVPGSQFDVIKRAGLSRDTYYKLFSPERANAPMRKATVNGLADALSLGVYYEDGFPQFSALNRDDSGIVTSVAHAQEAIKKVLDTGASLEYLASFSKIPIEELEQIMSAPNYSRTVPFRYLAFIAGAIGQDARIDPSGTGKIIIEPSRRNQFSLEINESTLNNVKLLNPFDDKGKIRTSDSGLLQLMEYENRRKHEIIDAEALELLAIAQRRNTQTTIDHWISILYALRALDKKEDI